MRETADINPDDYVNPDETKGLYVKFYFHPVQNKEKSLAEGRPVFDSVEYIEIVAAGSPSNIIRCPVDEIQKRRFHAQYALFKAGHEEQVTGTPLSEIPWLTVGQREELMYMKIRTIEALAEVADTVCTKIPGTFDLKKRAIAWVEKAKSDAPFEQMRQENDELKERLAALEAQMSKSKK